MFNELTQEERTLIAGWFQRVEERESLTKVPQCGECYEDAIGFWDTKGNGLLPLCGSCATGFFATLIPFRFAQKTQEAA